MLVAAYYNAKYVLVKVDGIGGTKDGRRGKFIYEYISNYRC